jgi:predicted porin
MLRSAERKRQGVRATAAAGLAAVALAAWPASAEDGSRLQPGGFMTHSYGLPSLAGGPAGDPQGLGRIEIGAGIDAAYPAPFAPSSVGLPLDSGWINDSMPAQGAADARPALSTERNAVSYFTPRLSGLQFGAAYAPPRPDDAANAAALLQAGRDPANRSDFALSVNYLESFQGIDVALTGGYRSISVPDTAALDVDLSDQDAELARYSVGTSIGFSGLTLGGFYAREVGDGPISVHSWDAGVSYASGPWTIGVDYLRSAFVDARAPGAEGHDQLQTVQAGLTYSVGPGIVASFNVLHSSLEDREGNATAGTLGILGFSYNF